MRILKNQGLDFQLQSKVLSIGKSGAECKVAIETSDGKREDLVGDVVLVGIGRRPYTDGLNLQNAGVEVGAKGFLRTDGKFRTNVSSVWAIGDVIEGPMLAHKAEEEGIAVAHLLKAGSGTAHVEHNLIPSVVYTHPEVAWVGRGEAELKAANVAYTVGKFPFMANSRAKANCIVQRVLIVP